MAKASEEISKYNSNSGGKTDSNLANDSNHLGGIPANEYATQEYVHNYHEAKEAIQKEYIDKQDEAKLQEAKAYADQVVDGQDFSPFAKLTDVQAVDTKLSDKITQETTNQKNYTDQKTKEIVNDVNNNFDDVHSVISNLKGNQDSLFQSVSNGKAKIAGAITDKGVATSANDSFDTMAGNIKSIPTGSSGSADPNYVNTSDATATASDILVGKTAYAQGNKIYGTLIAQAEAGMPTYGTDTSNATATAEDIVWGKTAYARGQLVTGTLRNVDIQEIYGVDNDIKINANPTLVTTDYITGEGITVGQETFSEDLTYCVRIETMNAVQYIGSYPINDKGLYIMQSTNISGETETKKYRYSKEDLGIPEDEELYNLKLAPSTENTTLLYVLTRKYGTVNTVYDYFLYIFTYHLRDNGVIGKEYENEKQIVNVKQKIASEVNNNNEYYIFPKHTNPNEFYIGKVSSSGFGVRSGRLILYEILINTDYTTQTISMKHEYSNLSSNNYSLSFFKRELSQNDKFLYNKGYVYNDSANVVYIDNETTNEIYGLAFRPNYYSDINNRFYELNQTSVDTKLVDIIQYNIVLEGKTLTNYKEKTISVDLSLLEQELEKYTLYFDDKYLVVYQDYILLFPINRNSNQMFCMLIDININNLTDGSTVKPSTALLYPLSSTFNLEYTTLYRNDNNSSLFVFNDFVLSREIENIINFGIDSNNIIGVKYKGKTFYSLEGKNLTAGGGDVRSGKTYIGWMGYPETGTAEF